MYQEMGIDQDVYAYGQKITEDLKERFAEIDETAEYNQLKVLHAMQKNRVSDIHFAATSGYGYNDLGRDTLESVYADTFHAEAGLVRPQITWFKREEDVIWLNKQDYAYDEDKILSIMLEILREKDIIK